MLSKTKITYLGIILLLMVVLFIPFNITGIKFVFGLIIIMSPFILLFNHLGMDFDEELIFGIFIGIVIFPLLVWYLNWFIPSLRITIFVVFFLLLFLVLAIRRFIPPNQNV